MVTLDGVISSTAPAHSNRTLTPSRRPTILLIDDSPDDRNLLCAALQGSGLEVENVENLSEGFALLRRKTFDLIVVDVFLNQENGIHAIPDLIRSAPKSKVVVVTGVESIRLAVDAMKRGASEFLTKSLDSDQMVDQIREILALGPAESASDSSFGLVGNSAAFQKISAFIRAQKEKSQPVLLYGEAGTGKRSIARALHLFSGRSGHRFVTLACSIQSRETLEKELFGGRERGERGLLETCSGGTLHLEEPAYLPRKLQVALVDLILRRSSSSESVRLTASTRVDLEQAVREGRYDERFYGCLSSVKFDVPSLRERSEDIPLLVNHFIEKFSRRLGKMVRFPSFEMMTRLQRYRWPENVQELQILVERGVLLSKDGALELRAQLEGMEQVPHGKGPSRAGLDRLVKPFRKAKVEFEKNYMLQLLRITQGNISEASRLSGTHRVQIYRFLEKHGLDPIRYKPGSAEPGI